MDVCDDACLFFIILSVETRYPCNVFQKHVLITCLWIMALTQGVHLFEVLQTKKESGIS